MKTVKNINCALFKDFIFTFSYLECKMSIYRFKDEDIVHLQEIDFCVIWSKEISSRIFFINEHGKLFCFDECDYSLIPVSQAKFSVAGKNMGESYLISYFKNDKREKSIRLFNIKNREFHWNLQTNSRYHIISEDHLIIDDGEIGDYLNFKTIKSLDIHSGNIIWEFTHDSPFEYFENIFQDILVAKFDSELLLINITSGQIVDRLKPIFAKSMSHNIYSVVENKITIYDIKLKIITHEFVIESEYNFGRKNFEVFGVRNQYIAIIDIKNTTIGIIDIDKEKLIWSFSINESLFNGNRKIITVKNNKLFISASDVISQRGNDLTYIFNLKDILAQKLV